MRPRKDGDDNDTSLKMQRTIAIPHGNARPYQARHEFKHMMFRHGMAWLSRREELSISFAVQVNATKFAGNASAAQPASTTSSMSTNNEFSTSCGRQIRILYKVVLAS